MSQTNTRLHIAPPDSLQVKELRQLWKDTFGDSDDFLDTFFKTAFSFNRCMCATLNNKIVAALYWFDCELDQKEIAYIYAVATAKEHRGQGLCHKLMEFTHNHLKENGYAGAILSPAEKSLFDFYERMRYQTCAYNKELHFAEDTLFAFEHKDIHLRKITKNEFAKLRRDYLGNDAVIQENENLDFLETQADFYAGENFLLAARVSDYRLNGLEFLGDETQIPHILNELSCCSGYLRTTGKEKPNGMYYSFIENKQLPSYLGFIFD